MIKEILKETLLFSSFSPEILSKVDQMSTVVNLPNEKTLFHQGQDAVTFYYVVKGLIKLTRISEEGTEKVIEIIRPGHFFAEALVFLNKFKYPVQATTISDTELIAINSRQYASLLKQSNASMFSLLGAMSMRIHQLVGDIESLTIYSTKSRLANYLLESSKHNSNQQFKLDLPKSTLASRLSMKPETLSRALAYFDKYHFIKIENKSITILDDKGLSEFIHQEK
ncbi:MAG: Crp/Fnr family transcriptional regulator [Gammaproteobacteria bacterium]|nr:Crp/Fnr family transcriptional regulator [Gammaproteobacteria bacterium]